MRTDRSGWTVSMRGLALAGIVLLGLVSIVGSGGGIGFPPCEGITCNTGPPVPPPSASVRPDHVTALVGTAVTYTVETANISGTLSYQWLRKSNGSAEYVEIAGATGPSYTLASVNLADDGARFLVWVQSSKGSFVQAGSQLAVSATPGLVFADGEFQPQDWLASPVVDAPPAGAPGVVTERIATGGNPGAFRRMRFDVPQGAGSVRVFYTSPVASYDPSSQGAVYVIDYSEDCISLPGSPNTFTESSLVIEQGGRRFISNTGSNCALTQWGGVTGRASLAPADFRLYDGPDCPAGQTCPDFSASAAPLRFGYWRISFGMPGDSIVHGIDNWKVTVWRR